MATNSSPAPSSTTSANPNPKNPNPGDGDTYNGCKTDKYSFSQTILELDVKIFIPPGAQVKKGKDVTVEIKSDSLSVRLKGQGLPAEPIIIEGQFAYDVRPNDCYWNLIPGECIQIYLQKAKERWWTSLLKGEPPIDMSQIEAIKPMEDLGDEEQMKIQELLWQDEQKRMGMESSKNKEMEEILKKSWNAPGSPFQGQPYDPSTVNFG